MRRILEQTRKELIQVIRDKRAILMALGLPAMLLVVMPQSISLTVDDLPIVVQDLDDSTASRLFIDAFRASITFRVIGWPVDEHPEAAFKANAARAALIHARLFSTGTAPSSHVCQMKQGGVSLVTWSSFERSRTCSVEGLVPSRLCFEPS